MKQIAISFSASQFSEHVLPPFFKTLETTIAHFNYRHTHTYETPFSFLQLPYDTSLRTTVHTLVNRLQQYNPKALIIIGIGGSNLGTAAVYEALLGKLYNFHAEDIAVYCADTVDSDALWDLVRRIEQHFEQSHDVIINIVSKSGTTLETCANMALFISLLKKYKGASYHQYVVVTTQKDSELWQLAKLHHYAVLEIPHPIGGRYSVLSAVGLFPLALLGIDIDALHAGARDITRSLISNHPEDNHAATSAAIIAHHYLQGLHIHNSFFFSVDLDSLGKWYRQLMGESLGKITDQKVRVGIMPVVSIGSIDLHSVGQLYLAGPRSTFTSFISVAKPQATIILDDIPYANQSTHYIAQKTYPELMHALFQGTQRAYDHEQLPYMTIELPEKNAYYIGQFLQFHMIQMVYLGYALHVNPFDQPHVELYKRETRKILSHE